MAKATVSERHRFMRPWTGLNPWSAGAMVLCGLVLIPILVVLSHAFVPAGEVWGHLAETLLVDLVENTLVLLAGVATGTLLLGTGMAWLTSVCEFPGRRLFEWAVILPFAFPTYVLGYVMLDLFGISGPVQGWMRRTWGEVPAWFPEIQSAGGVIGVMVCAFYPYVYLLARTAFRSFGNQSLEVARSLGYGPWRAYLKVVVPLARPWIFGGLLLVIMETLADFGTVSIFNFDTFTTAIYKAWYGFFSIEAAAQLACILLVLALLLIGLEKRVQTHKKYYDLSSAEDRIRRMRLGPLSGWLACAGMCLVLAVAFGLPMAHLLVSSAQTLEKELNAHYWELVTNTATVAALAAALICGGSLFLNVAARRGKAWLGSVVAGATLGYALPGTVLAVGVFIPLAWLDSRIEGLSLPLLGSVSLVNGTLAAMLAAYCVRFLAVAHQPLSASLQKIRPDLDEAARGLGHGGGAILRKIHLPLLRPGLITAFLLVLIDVMKEMPITLMTRPFQWDTLSIRIFELTSEGEYQRAALPSLLLVLTGLIPVAMLIKFSNKKMDITP